ncbi:sugar efflux transporter [Dactylosporangium sp. NPDC000555]|uniref:sugar efflux transporter n=1 Tax=Dactylosporangium sp. NPDC000555 TaxID=3154260 RepID=UPI00332C10A0
MIVESTPRPRHLALALLPLGLVFLAVGVATAVVYPFLSLFLSTEVRAGPARVTAFLVAAPLAGVVVSTLVARLSDRRPIRRALLIAAAGAGLLSSALTAVVRDYWALLALAVTATALAGVLFPQTFAYARQVLMRDDPARSALGTSALRTVFSLAWVGGPPLAALILAAGGFTAVYGMAAVMYALAGLVAVLLLRRDEAPAPPVSHDTETGDGPGRGRLWLSVAAFTMLQCPLTLGAQALPLFVTGNLGGGIADAGLILGLCAALEIPIMLGLGMLSTRVRLRALVLAGAVCGVLYQALAATAHSVWLLAGGQVLNACFIAAVSALGMSYLQDMLPGQPGRASTLFSNTFPIGAMLAGPLFGIAQQFGFRWAYGIGTAMCAAGLAVLMLTRPAARSGRDGATRRGEGAATAAV